MKIYVIRRDLLPDGYSLDTVYAMTAEQMAHEMNRQIDIIEAHGITNNYLAIYDPIDFEDLINLEEGNGWNPSEYYIRFFNE